MILISFKKINYNSNSTRSYIYLSSKIQTRLQSRTFESKTYLLTKILQTFWFEVTNKYVEFKDNPMKSILESKDKW
jgi:hypothetical protein